MGGSPGVAAMLELMEKLQVGAPATSEQLFSSCRYPRASENSLWQERTGGQDGWQGSSPLHTAQPGLLAPPRASIPSCWAGGKLRPREEPKCT